MRRKGKEKVENIDYQEGEERKGERLREKREFRRRKRRVEYLMEIK